MGDPEELLVQPALALPVAPEQLRPLLDVSFLEGGRTLAGFDCYGGAILYWKLRGRELPDFWPMIAARWTAGDRVIEHLTPPGCVTLTPPWPAPLLLQDCDLLVTGKQSTPSHIAAAVDQWHVLHTARGRRSRLIPAEQLFPELLWIWRATA